MSAYVKKDWTILLYNDGIYDKIMVSAYLVEKLNDSSILIRGTEDVQLTFETSQIEKIFAE
jgi:hypothetical protein